MPYDLRSRLERIAAFVQVPDSDSNVTMANPIIMTPEQLTALLAGMKNMLTTDTNPVPIPETAHNFSKMSISFWGKERRRLRCFYLCYFCL